MADIVEVWREAVTAPGYQISDQGRCKTLKGRIRNGKPTPKGYIHSLFGKKLRMLHVVIAETFIPNPEGKKIVNHINGIRDDNRVINLEWATAKENSNKQIFPSAKRGKARMRPVIQLNADGSIVREWKSVGAAASSIGLKGTTMISAACRSQKIQDGYRWAYADELAPPLLNEQWKPITSRQDGEEVSNLGRVKTKTGKIIVGSLNGGYLYYVNAPIHRFVAIEFVPNPLGLPMVNHKDGNKENNAASNLEWVTASENNQHAWATGLRSASNAYTRRAVKRIHDNGIEELFTSLTSAAKITGVPQGEITRICQGQKAPSAGSTWEYVDPPLKMKDDPVISSDHLWSELSFDLEDVYEIPIISDDDPLWVELDL